MPGTYTQPDLYLVLRQILQRLRAVETQQQGTFTNGKGLPIITTGYIAGSGGEYGFSFYAPTLASSPGPSQVQRNGQLAFFGEDTDGKVALKYYDGTGTLISQYDENGLHFYNSSGQEQTRLDAEGFHSYDTSGHEVTRTDATGVHLYDDTGEENAILGLLPNSQYGIAVWNTERDGSYGWLDYQNYAFGNWSQVGTSQSTTSTTWADLATAGPSVSLDVGSEGFALVRASAMIEAPGDQTVSVGVSIDGAAPTFAQMQFANGAASPINTPLFAEIGYTGLAPGNHTFKLQYETSGGTATFWNRYLFVSNGG